MAKTKTPFFSLAAHGSVGGVITSQKRSSSSFMRVKPTPADPYSLPQAYQRWLYEDYAYRWTQQTDAVKAAYRLSGSRHHRTAFQEWMSYCLNNLPDIAGMWHLDTRGGTVILDSSRNENNGVKNGSTYSSGLIDGALTFDGLNDQCPIPYAPSLEPPLWTFDFFFRARPQFYTAQGIFGKAVAAPWELMTYIPGSFKLYIYNNTATGLKSTISNIAVCDNVWRHCALVNNGTNLSIYFNGVLDNLGAGNGGNTLYYHKPLILGARRPLSSEWFRGDLDHFVWYNRALDITEIKRHAARRYSA